MWLTEILFCGWNSRITHGSILNGLSQSSQPLLLIRGPSIGLLTSLMSCVTPGWGGIPSGDCIWGEQGSYLGPAEATAARYGPVQSGAAHLHPGATLFPGQAVRLLLSRWPAFTVSNFKSLCVFLTFVWSQMKTGTAFISHYHFAFSLIFPTIFPTSELCWRRVHMVGSSRS